MIIEAEKTCIIGNEYDWEIEDNSKGLRIQTTGGWYLITSNIKGELQLNKWEEET